MGHHACPQRIQFDIAINYQYKVIRINQRRFISPLPQRARAAIRKVKVLNVSKALSLHQPTNALLITERHQQMHMVDHKHESMNEDLIFACRLLER
jgi:hypothetical protein